MKVGKFKKAAVEGRLLDACYMAIKGHIKKFFSDLFRGRFRKGATVRIDRLFQTAALKRMSKKSEIKNNKILFMTTRGTFNCNPRSIAEEIIRQKLPWELVWVTRKENMNNPYNYPPQLKLVVQGSEEFYKEALEAKVWIDNSVGLSYMNIQKNKDQILVETWHGSIGLKRFETSSDRVWIKRAKHCGARTDYCLSNSRFETELFKNTFWSGADIKEFGHARNDILFDTNSDRRARIIENVKTELNIPEGVKIALYAPTFRDGGVDLRVYDIDYKGLKNSLESRFGGEWIVITRLHFEVKRRLKKKKVKYPGFVTDATEYDDIQDLLLVADVGITDYSSWICDYILTRKPAFFFATDLEKQYSARGFYFPLDSTPIPLCQDNFELFEAISAFDVEEYDKKCREFFEYYGCMEDGHAAERTIDLLKTIIRGN